MLIITPPGSSEVKIGTPTDNIVCPTHTESDRARGQMRAVLSIKLGCTEELV